MTSHPGLISRRRRVVALITGAASYFGARYFGRRYFGKRYFG